MYGSERWWVKLLEEDLANEARLDLVRGWITAVLLARAQLMLVLVEVIVLHQLGRQFALNQVLFVAHLAHAQLVAF